MERFTQQWRCLQLILLIFLLDLIAGVPGRQWLPFTLALLNAYDNALVIAQLSRQLAPPSGMAWI